MLSLQELFHPRFVFLSTGLLILLCGGPRVLVYGDNDVWATCPFVQPSKLIFVYPPINSVRQVLLSPFPVGAKKTR